VTELVSFALSAAAQLTAAGRHPDALAVLREASALAPGAPAVAAALGRTLDALGQLDEAAEAYATAFAGLSDDVALGVRLVDARIRQNRAADARAIRDQLAAAHPERAELDYLALQCVPIVYTSDAEIASVRAQYRADLDRLAARVRSADGPTRAALRRAAAETGNFYISYQGQDERPDQERFGAILGALAEGWLPAPRPRARAPGERVRVVIVSSVMRHHTVGKLLRGLVEQVDRTRIALTVVQLGGPGDPMGEAIAAAAEHALSLPFGLESVVAAVRRLEPDVALFPEVGMLGLSAVLASAPLAPVQAVFWGHPITTGLPTVSRFLSSAGMEPPGAEAHYSEQLVPLPGIGIYYARPASLPEPLPRADIGVPEHVPLLLSCQSLFKYLPARDALLVAVAAAVPEAVLVFLAHASTGVTAAFRDRLTRAFAASGLSFDARCRILPRLDERTYLALNRAADLFLDTPDWSGGNTCLEALACGLPVVTLPGAFLRGRHSAAMLAALGLDAPGPLRLVAVDADDYVQIAARMCRDPDLRAAARAHIDAHADARLFAQTAPVRAMEDALIAAATPD
jgi:predicted O-linked N-acetylglucosamine transferase (SPINDLY family)